MKLKHLILGTMLVGVLNTGCVNTGRVDLAPRVERLATAATPLILKKNPEMRPGFIAAQIALEELGKDDKVTMDDVLTIVYRLPIDKLESPEAVLIVEGGLILIDPVLGGSAIDLSKLGSAQQIATALAAGIKKGLE